MSAHAGLYARLPEEAKAQYERPAALKRSASAAQIERAIEDSELSARQSASRKVAIDSCEQGPCSISKSAFSAQDLGKLASLFNSPDFSVRIVLALRGAATAAPEPPAPRVRAQLSDIVVPVEDGDKCRRDWLRLVVDGEEQWFFFLFARQAPLAVAFLKLANVASVCPAAPPGGVQALLDQQTKVFPFTFHARAEACVFDQDMPDISPVKVSILPHMAFVGLEYLVSGAALVPFSYFPKQPFAP